MRMCIFTSGLKVLMGDQPKGDQSSVDCPQASHMVTLQRKG